MKKYDISLSDITSLLCYLNEDEKALVTSVLQSGDYDFFSKKLQKIDVSLILRKIGASIAYNVPFPPVKTHKFRFIDLFAGIGGTRLAFQNLGGKCVFSSEWDDASKQTYYMNFGEYPWGDITKIDTKDIPDHDVLLAGFPCQPFSIAGVSKKNSLGRLHGFSDETQGTLFYDIVRILKEKQPSAFLLENVKNLKSHDKGNTFRVISENLNDLEYVWQAKILDAKYYVPQHRERIIIVGFRKDLFDKAMSFEYPDKSNRSLIPVSSILEESIHEKYTLSDHLWQYLQNYALKHKLKGNGFSFGLASLDGITRTLSARYYKDGSEILIPQDNGNPRRLTPRECARLMGFPDDFIPHPSDSKAYKQFGNSIVVPLIEDVGKEMIRVISLRKKI